MSSREKDARWQLAIVMADAADLDFFELAYWEQNALLDVAQSELDRHPQRVWPLAKAFNERN